jgi:DNA end-binding protein Ku
VEITDDELEAIAVQGMHTIEIDQFVPKDEIDEIYWAVPYYIVPDGDAGRQAFSVIREAIKKEQHGRTWPCGVHDARTCDRNRTTRQGHPRPHAPLPLRSPRWGNLFRRYYCREIPKDMLDLAIEIVRSKTGHFQPKKFEDHYERALRKLIGKKRRGEKIEKTSEHPQAQSST